MRILNKVAFCALASVISSYTYANVIELDAFNPDHCRQQILQSTDEMPVIAAYMTGNSDSDAFMQKFETLAKTHPERTFYKWDSKKDWQHATQSLCLQQLGIFIQPSIMLVAVVKDANNGQVIMSSPLRLEWAGEMTMPEMTKFIDISDFGVKKSIAALKAHQ